MTPALLPIEDARSRILAAAGPLAPERVAIADALGRVLAEDVIAPCDVPGFASSAMDGYAVLAGPAGRVLRVIDESRAGCPSGRALAAGEAIRISTGAAVPHDATAVIRQEDVESESAPGSGNGQPARITTTAAVGVGQNIREPGEAIRAGTVVLTRGTVISPAAIGVAVAAGAASLVCGGRPRVSILCTGDELRAPGEPLGPAEIHNSNGPMLAALAARCGARVDPPQHLRDDAAVTQEALARAAAHSDVIIVSGGVSVGPHDHVKPAVARLGIREVFWGVRLQPGKPTWFGIASPAPAGPDAPTRPSVSAGRSDLPRPILVYGLPGNPVSAFVTFTLFVAPALARLQGAPGPTGRRPAARLAVPVRRNQQREQALRVRLSDRGGETVATPTGAQGSHVVTSLLGADALAFIPAGHGELGAGTLVALERLVT